MVSQLQHLSSFIEQRIVSQPIGTLLHQGPRPSRQIPQSDQRGFASISRCGGLRGARSGSIGESAADTSVPEGPTCLLMF